MTMKIELKNLKHAHAMSEETQAFTADIHVDGKKVGYARNSGTGGATMINPFEGQRERLTAAEQWARQQPDIDSGMIIKGKPFMIQSSLENIVDDQVTEDLMWQDLKKDCRRGVVVLHEGKTGVYRYKAGMSAANKAKWIEQAKARGEIVLNELPRAQALQLMREETQPIEV